jgi:phage terminase small subunit
MYIFWGYLYMTKKLTQKQENFARLFVELGNQSEAYRQAYDTQAGYETVNVSACKLLKQPNIAQRVAELRENIAMKHEVTVDSLLQELEEARVIASTCETPQSSAMIAATMGKAKLCGLDKQLVETTIRIADDGSNEW